MNIGKVILLTRESPYQIFCANQLFSKGYLSHVVFESGQSAVKGLLDRSFRDILSKGLQLCAHPRTVWAETHNVFNFENHFGQRAYHHQRILKGDFDKLDAELAIKKVLNINASDTIRYIRDLDPNLVFVFGTRIIIKDLFSSLACPVINMHWGVSPQYRGEGIVSALSHEGPKALGVTVHYLDQTSDGGDIIFQHPVEVDREDNFYSIGLKMAVEGTGLFLRVAEYLEKGITLPRLKQDLSKGRLFSVDYMRCHPEMRMSAWKNLQTYIRENL